MASKSQRSLPVALTIAGSDSSAGAGIQADLKTFSALGVYGLTAVTCVVAEMPGKVARIQDISTDVVREQIEVLLNGFPIAAIKTGMLYSSEIISLVAKTLATRAQKIPIVVDPVMVASSGDVLLKRGAIACYERELFPLASLITPNLDEAAQLLGGAIRTITRMRTSGKKLFEKYRVPILLKGGHLTSGQAIDLLFDGTKVTEFAAPFVRGVSTHGTGCTYSAAIAAGLALGFDLENAVRHAKKFVSAAIAQHFQWQQGSSSVHALNHSPNE